MEKSKVEKRKIWKSKIVEHIEIAKGIYQVKLFAPKVTCCSRAGQFVNVYLEDKSKLLPRPISICEIQGDNLVLVYGVVGKGTAELSTYVQGQEISILGPLGNGFALENKDKEWACPDWENIRTAVLVGGGIGVPPMVELANSLQGKVEQIIAVVGFKDEPFLTEALAKFCSQVYVATDSGKSGFRGNVIELMEEENLQGDYYFACGPKVMLENLTKYCGGMVRKDRPEGVPIQVSLEERMGCGYGACVGCTCKVKDNSSADIFQRKVCTDGPVFLGNEVVWRG